VPSSGIWQISAGVNLATGTSTGGVGALALVVNGAIGGTRSKRGAQFQVAAGNNVGYTTSSLFRLYAGDYVEIGFYQNSGGNITVQADDGGSATWFNGFLVQLG
jgi:hypothetical protein